MVKPLRGCSHRETGPKEDAPWKGAGTVASAQERLVELRFASLEQLQMFLLEADLAVQKEAGGRRQEEKKRSPTLPDQLAGGRLKSKVPRMCSLPVSNLLLADSWLLIPDSFLCMKPAPPLNANQGTAVFGAENEMALKAEVRRWHASVRHPSRAHHVFG